MLNVLINSVNSVVTICRQKTCTKSVRTGRCNLNALICGTCPSCDAGCGRSVRRATSVDEGKTEARYP